MATLRVHKVVATLPNPLDPDAIYAVRVGAGFDLYISDATGSVAHKINGGASGGWDFVSGELTVAQGTVISAAHGLGAVPSDWRIILRCKSTDRNYQPGDEVDLTQFYQHSGKTAPITPWANATEIGFSIAGAGNSGGISLVNKGSTNNTNGLIDLTKWVAVIKAKA